MRHQVYLSMRSWLLECRDGQLRGMIHFNAFALHS